LGDSNAGDDARRADGSRSDTDFDGVGAGLSQHFGSCACGDVAYDDVHILETGFGFAQFFDNVFRVAVGGVDDDGVDASLDEGFHAVECVVRHADACGHAEAAFGVLAGHGLVFGFRNIFIGDQADKSSFAVDDRELLNLVFLQDL